MKTTLFAAGFLLITASAFAQDHPKMPTAPPDASVTQPGYDRPDPSQETGHAHVIYWNNDFEQMDVTVESAADAYTVGEFVMQTEKHKK